MNTVFKALSDSTRREILQLLKDKDLTAGEIYNCFSMSKPAISKHLDILKTADLVSCVKKGQYIYYSVNTTSLQNVLGDFLSFFSEVTEKSECNEQES